MESQSSMLADVQSDGPNARGRDYYANYAGLSVDDYVARHIRGSASEMERMRRTVELVPLDVRSLLDVGAGHGVFLEELKAARDLDGVGIEITPAKVNYARSRGIDLRLGDASQLRFGDGAFDAVVSCEVLEHLPFGVYESALREFARVARRWVVLTVPFDEMRCFVQCPYCSAHVNPDYHFRSFPPGSMQGLLAGFRLERTLQLGARKQSWLHGMGKGLFGRWPPFLVCPCCGFQSPPLPPRVGDAPESTARALARRVARWIPASNRPIWQVGIYRREGDHA